MATLEADFLNPLWAAIEPLFPVPVDTHPFGGHRPRVSNRVVFERILEVVINGLSYRRAGNAECSASTIRRRRDEWIQAGVFEKLLFEAKAAYRKMIGYDLSNISVDGTHTVTPRGGEASGPSPVNRGKLGTKLSTVVDANGLPLGTMITGGNRHDSPLLAPTLDLLLRNHDEDLPDRVCVHLDAGYDSGKTREMLDELGFDYVISKKGTPLQAGKRWHVEATHAWMKNYKGLGVCNERQIDVVKNWVQFVGAMIIIKKLVKIGFIRYRWKGRPSKWRSDWGRNPSSQLRRWAKDHRYHRWSN